jgi:hypothetical protein
MKMCNWYNKTVKCCWSHKTWNNRILTYLCKYDLGRCSHIDPCHPLPHWNVFHALSAILLVSCQSRNMFESCDTRGSSGCRGRESLVPFNRPCLLLVHTSDQAAAAGTKFRRIPCSTVLLQKLIVAQLSPHTSTLYPYFPPSRPRSSKLSLSFVLSYQVRLISPMLATCLAHPIFLDFLITISSEEYKLWSFWLIFCTSLLLLRYKHISRLSVLKQLQSVRQRPGFTPIQNNG